ncbi:lyase family protein [Streptomyces sp. NPDC001118]
MKKEQQSGHVMSGRIKDGPSRLLHDEVLKPQFDYEVANLLPWYAAIEKVLALEYLRMGLINSKEAVLLGQAMNSASTELLSADPESNMSDISFALERYVEEAQPAPVTNWHVDRSRNDLQVCAQVLFACERLRCTADLLMRFGETVHRIAMARRHEPMPGYTHFQAAQIITPGFYLSALSEHVLHTAQRLLAAYDFTARSPLGSGAMAGQELPWDRERMSRLLGLPMAQPHALISVASRHWAAEITAEISLFGLGVSRFSTDLLTWGSSEYGFIDLPDELSGISSAMPQKKNLPVLERIRGRTAHLSSYHFDMVLGQRNTPYSNLVEVSKEAGAHLKSAFDAMDSVLRLFTSVMENLSFRSDKMLAACESEYLGGFTLANLLTTREKVPWRVSQVISGQYIVAAMAVGRTPRQPAPELLVEAAAAKGYTLSEPDSLLREAFDIDGSLTAKKSTGSVHPDAVLEVLHKQDAEYQRQRQEWEARRRLSEDGLAEANRLLLSGDGTE